MDAYYKNSLQFKPQPPHVPSPIELTALERELQEINSWCQLRAQQYRLPVKLTSQLLTIAQNARQALGRLACYSVKQKIAWSTGGNATLPVR